MAASTRSSPSPSVLIVGAGPVGLAAAVELTRLGARVRIVDQRQTRTSESRAIGVNPRTLELLEPSGVTPRLIAAGVQARGMQVFARQRLMATFDLTRIRHRYAFMLALPQSETERILEERLGEMGIAVERARPLESLASSAREVEVTLAGERAVFDWVVGADGAHSVVRKAIGAAFPGERYPFQWSLADVVLKGDVAPDKGDLHLDPGQPVLFRLPIGPGRHRVISNAADVLARLPRDWVVESLIWRSDFTVSHRLANRIEAGRTVIIGDAAHIHSPAGGRGMNLGIEDAATLAPRIVEGDLGDWTAQRQARARQVVAESDRLQRLATNSGYLSRRLVPRLAAAAARIPFLHDAFVQRIGSVDPQPA